MQHIDLRCWWLASSVYFACVVGIIQAQSCTRPSPGKHMVHVFSTSADISQDEYIEESTFNFKCDFGFERVGGSPTIICRNGKWTDVTLDCAAKNCGFPGTIDNGYFEIPHKTTHLNKAIFHCIEGHILVGKKERMCRDGTWDGRNPVCEVVKCGVPPVIEHGEITSSLEEFYDYGSVVLYQCKADLTLDGARRIACEDDGTWKPDPPRCIHVQCAPPLIENSIRTAGNPPYGYRSYVSFECRKGFIREGVSGLTCGIDSNWTSPYPICKSRAGPPTPPAPTAAAPIIILSPGSIAAVVLGVIAAVVFLCVVFFFCCCRKKKRSSQPFNFRKVLTKDDAPQPGDKSDDHAL